MHSYSPLKRGGGLHFTNKFGSLLPLQAGDDISLPVDLVTRFGEAAPTLLNFSFEGLPVSCP